MKPFAFLYVSIYQRCAQRTSIPDESFVRIQAMYLFSLSAAGWVLLLQAMYLRFVKISWFSTPAHSMLFAVTVYALTALVLYRIFITNETDQKIVNRYGANRYEKSHKKIQEASLVVLYMAPYLLLFLLAIAFPRAAQF